MTREEFSKLSQGLPGKPGIYKYFNREGIIIYVGKAKNLRKRVSSYFIKKHNYYKTERLVQEIHQLECVLVESEQDALLLENALIKEFQPKYNLMLKDDKSYPYIVIRNEEFPRVFLTRRLIRDGSEYLGPFTSVEQVRSLLDLIRQTLPLRSCKLPLTRKRIQEGRFRDCLEYHIGNCKAPCTGKQSFEEYRWYVEQVKEILKGKLGTIIKTYKDEMRQLAEQLEYEKAEIVKKRIEFLRNYQSRSVIVNPRLGDLDVCCIVSDEHSAWVHYIILTQGSIRQSHSVEVIKKLDERDQDILPQILFQLREKFQSQHVQIISNIEFSFGSNSLVSVPRGGDKKKLLELAEQNLIYFMREQKRQASLHLQEKTDQEHIELLHEVMHDLRLPQLPLHIECFDNSNFQGGAPVSAMVCFKNGIPDKKNYRHFHIKTVEGIDDFASMAETVYRRYKRVLEEKLPLPQLIIIDGGKGQLNAALESLRKLGIRNQATVIGLAKNVEEIFFPGDQQALRLPYDSETLHFITRIRDEVHRFGIQFHRKTRSRGTIKNDLENIEGIGPQTALQLLSHFRSAKAVAAASLPELQAQVGKSKAGKIYQHFHP